MNTSTEENKEKERLPDGFIERIEKILHEKNMSKNEFIRQAGLNSNVFSDWRHRASYPVSSTILRISKLLETSMEYLLEGKDSRVLVVGNNGTSNAEFIPEYFENKQKTVRKTSLWIPAPEWLEYIDGEKFCIRITGDYMEPTIQNGSILICVESSSMTSDGLYAVRLNNIVSIKRLSVSLFGINVSCDNEKYPSWSINLDDDKKICIIGRVVGVLGKIA